jgi:hypothetical protein
MIAKKIASLATATLIALSRPVSSSHPNVILGLSQPIGKSGLNWSLQGIIGGENRYGIRQSNKGVGSVSYVL